jgi:hypothetical protein
MVGGGSVDSLKQMVRASISGAIVIASDMARPLDDTGFCRMIEEAREHGVAGFQGIKEWSRLHWRAFGEHVSGGFLSPTSDGRFNLSLGLSDVAASVALADGGLVAMRSDVANVCLEMLDEKLSAIPSLMVEDWIKTMTASGDIRCVVDCSFGVVVESRKEFDLRLAAPALIYANEKYGFPVFGDEADERGDYSSACVGGVEDVRACLFNLGEGCF